MGTAIKHPVPDRVEPLFVIFDIRTYAQDWASECPDVKNYIWWLNPVWHRMLYCCTHMATVGVKGLKHTAICSFLSAEGSIVWCCRWYQLLNLICPTALSPP